MAHSKRRLPVPLSEDAYAALMRYSEVTGSSLGATAGVFLEQLAPQIAALAEAIQVAKTDPVRGADLLKSAIEKSFGELDEEQLSMFGN